MANILMDVTGGSFLIGDYIDKGSFSKVYALECCSSKKRLAGKFISKEKLKRFGIIDKVWDEIKIHQVLRHQNIVQFLSFIDQERDIVIILEYCSRYSMVHVLHELKKLTPGEAKYFMSQTVSAVDYLHKSCIVHRDLKLGNLFVNKNLEIKLGDFGLAVVIEHESQKRFSRCGTPNYLAPEVINGVGHSYEVDIWALGCILHTMLEGKPPFQGKNTTDTYNNILKGRYRFSPGVEFTAKAFVMGCLQPDPLKRPSVSSLLSFEFLTSTEIAPEAPEFVFGQDETLILSSKRVKHSEPKFKNNPFSVTKVVGKEYPLDCFMSLFSMLRSVKEWTESTLGEFVSEQCAYVPLVWVNSWIDYTNTYGFAYQLSNKNSGLIFNDETRMLYQKDEGFIQYSQNDNSVVVCRKEAIPEALKKKVKILISCQNYMNNLLCKAHESKATKELEKHGQSPTEVSRWVKGSNEVVVMFLTNGSVQLNFSGDHTKLILCGFTKTVTIIESAMYMKTLQLGALRKYGCSSVLKTKLYVASKYIYRFIVDKKS